MPIISSSRLCCLLPHWSYRSWLQAITQLCLSLQSGHYSSLTATYLQPTANQEGYDQCGNQQYSRELLTMSIVMPKTCWAHKKYNKITSGNSLVFYSSVIKNNVGWCDIKTVFNIKNRKLSTIHNFLTNFQVSLCYNFDKSDWFVCVQTAVTSCSCEKFARRKSEIFNRESDVPLILKTLIMLDVVVIYFGYQWSQAASI